MEPVVLDYPAIPSHLACLKAKNPFDPKDEANQKLYREYCHPYEDFFKILDLKLLKEAGLVEVNDKDLVWNREGKAKVAYYNSMIDWLANGASPAEEHKFVLRSPLNRSDEANFRSLLRGRVLGVKKDKAKLVAREAEKVKFYEKVFSLLKDRYWAGEQVFNRARLASKGKWWRFSFIDPLGTVTLFSAPEEFFRANFTACKARGTIKQEIDPNMWTVRDIFGAPSCGPTLVTIEANAQLRQILTENQLKLPHVTQNNIKVYMRGKSPEYGEFVAAEEAKLSARHKDEIVLQKHKNNPHPVHSEAWTKFTNLKAAAAKRKAAAVSEMNEIIKVAKEYRGE